MIDRFTFIIYIFSLMERGGDIVFLFLMERAMPTCSLRRFLSTEKKANREPDRLLSS
jgi:hypothetical protein